MEIRVALVGCGAAAELLYAPPLGVLEKEGLARVVVLVDPSSERRAALGKFFPSAKQRRDMNAVLSEGGVTMAIVCAPHRYHADLSIVCLRKGIHVLCEKPMASSSSECDRMIAAATESRSLLAVGHVRRFFPSSRLVKQLLSLNVLGPVRSFRFLEGESFGWPARSASFFKRSASGGGVLIDTGAHTLDLLIWWLGDVVDVRYADDAMGGVEANCALHLTIGGGARGFVQLSRDWPLPNRYVVECERGWLAVSCGELNRFEWGLRSTDYRLAAEIRSAAGSSAPMTANSALAAPDFKGCLVEQLRSVFAAIRGETELEVPGSEARKVIAVIEECYSRRRLLPAPWLDEEERRRAQELSRV